MESKLNNVCICDSVLDKLNYSVSCHTPGKILDFYFLEGLAKFIKVQPKCQGEPGTCSNIIYVMDCSTGQE